MSNTDDTITTLSDKDKQTIQDEILSKGGVAIRGGYRPNAGRPRGSKNKLTKDAKVREKTIKERILKNVDELVNSQLALAKGVQYLYQIRMRNVAGRRKPEHILIKDPKKIKAFLDGDLEDEYCYLSTQAPDNKAIDSLLDRAFGKATTQGNVNHDFNVNLISYETKTELPTYREGRIEEADNNSPQLLSEGLPVGTPPSTTKVQDSGMAPTFREIQDGSEQSDTQSPTN